ncbi:MAG: T9SS type A sorting domain-containing protein [Bacteroidales bacterium]|nr:T9SS type A sorting domain-containing protein [Bacteroidales bacterium]
MKKVFLLISVVFIFQFAAAQGVMPITNNAGRDFSVLTGLQNFSVAKSPKSNFSRWYNYGETMDLFNGTTTPTLNGNYLFPDSTILVNYGTSGYSGTWIHKLGDLLDVTSDMFNNVVLHPGELNLDAASYYSLDSIEFWFIYERNMPDQNIVDTLVFEICTNNNLSTVYFGPGTLSTNLGTDTVYVKNIPYSYQTNSLNLPNKQIYKYPLTQATLGDSLSNGIHIAKIATTGMPTVNPGMLVFTSVGFIPGYTWVPNVDTIHKKNNVLFISRKERNNDYPVYTKNDYNISYIVPVDVRYNQAASWNGLYIPSFAYMGSAPTYRYEHHLIYYKVSSSFNITFNSQNVSCYGGADGYVNMTVAGGVAPYTYQWSNGATTQNIANLSAGIYTVTIVDADSSMAMRMFNITQPQPLQATVSSTPASGCGISDGSINVTNILGGTPSYSIVVLDADSITQGITDLAAGIYTVKVTDSEGCKLVSLVTINETGAPVLNTTVENVSCYGLNDGSINLAVVNPLSTPTYNWNTSQTSASLTNLSPGQYWVTVTDGNCHMYRIFNITQPEVLGVTGTVANATGGNPNGSIILNVTGGTPAYTYAWSSGQTTANIGSLPAGSYTVTVTDSELCTAVASFNIISTGINEGENTLSKLKIYPNPVSDMLYVEAEGFEGNLANLTIYSVQGQALKSIDFKVNQNMLAVPFSEFSAGIYFVELKVGNKRLFRKVIK